MGKQIKTIIYSVIGLLSVGFFLFIANQIHGLYQLANAVNPIFGQVTLWGLIILMGVLMVLPVILVAKLPKALNPSDADEDPVAYQQKLKKRLQSNKILKTESISIERDGDLQAAVKVLDEKADEEIKKVAATVFLTTAVSQNGKLDALTVLITQSKLVWKVAHIYYQRPNLKDMLNLYGNVGASTFMASEIEDLDISEQFQPVIQAMMKNTATKSIPIVGSTANLIMDSLLEGTTNAFLTLRVGVIAKKYCGNLDGFDRTKTKKRAYIEASEMLGKIVLQSSGKIVSSVAHATKKASVDTIKSGIDSIKTAGAKVGEGIASTAKKIIPGKKADQQLIDEPQESSEEQ